MAKGLKIIILKLRESGLSYKEICKELNCTIGVVSYHCHGDGRVPIDKQKISDEIQLQIKGYCKIHTDKEAVKKFGICQSTIKKYRDRKIKRKLTEDEKITKNRINVLNRRKKLKLMSIEYLGGSCKICKYDNCPSALEFHHKNPNQKDFNICRGTIAWKKIKKELNKCVLLCCRCHREFHAGLIKICPGSSLETEVNMPC